MILLKKYAFFTAVCLLFTLLSCNKDDGGEDGENNDPSEVTAAEILNANFTVNRPGTFEINPDDVEIDNSIIVTAGGNGTAPIRPGDAMDNQIFFQNNGGSTINAVGMRFGNSGPITFVPVTQEELDNGLAILPFLIDLSVCEDIAQICHDIKCYEFAYTDAGQISQADLQDIALICGACEEPSCLDLLEPSACSGVTGEDGSPRFNLTWSGASDLDLYVTDPNGETISYQNPSAASGGMLDVDCTGNCTGGNSENITWPQGGPSGTYTFYVNYFSGSGTVNFNILVRDNLQDIRTESGSVTEAGTNSASFTYVKS